jgi:hypothetical protein
LAYVWVTSCLKLSLLFFYIRIFHSTNLQKWIYTAIAIQAAFVVSFTFVIVFQCIPVSYAWQYWDREHRGKCINTNAASWSLAGITIALDIIVLLLPVRDLWILKMSRTKKGYIMFMFGLGFFVTIISILRLHTLVKFAKTFNFTYDNFPAVYWSSLEGCFGTVALCLPTLRPLLGAIAPKVFGTASTATKTSTTRRSRLSVFSRITMRRDNTAASSRALYSNASEPPESADTFHTEDTIRSNQRKPTHAFDMIA